MSEGGFLPPLILELRAKAGELFHELGQARHEIRKTAEEAEGGGRRTSSAFHGMASAGKALTFGIVGAGVAVGAFALDAALAGQKTDALLDTALKNAHSSLTAFSPAILTADAHLRTLGYTNAQTNEALASMTIALGSPKKALADLGLASDLARLKGISLAQAGILVAKAAEGQTRPLKALGIDLPVMAGGAKAVAQAQLQVATATTKARTFLAAHSDAVQKSSKYHLTYMQMLDKVHLAQQKLTGAQGASTKILAALRARVGGVADAYGGTLQGKIAAAHAQLDAFGETIGNKLIPVITTAIGIATSFASAVASNRPALIAVGAVLGVVAAALVTAYIAQKIMNAYSSLSTVVTKGWAAAQWLLNAALDANPIGLIVIGVVALIAVIVLIATKTKWFQNLWHAAWGAITNAARATWSWIKSAWSTVFTVISAPIGKAVSWVASAWGKIPAVFSAVLGGIRNVIGRYVSVLTLPFRMAFDTIATLWNNTLGRISFTIPSWIPVIGGKGFSFPKIPLLAKGGRITSAGSVMVGDAGPEILHLSPGASVEPLPVGGGSSSGGGLHLHLHVTGNNFIGGSPADARRFADHVWPALQEKALRDLRRNGFSTLTGQTG